MLFVDGSGNLGQSNANLYWDTVNSRVGIGSGAPGARLDVMGSGITSSAAALTVENASGASIIYARNDGNVGIGTTGPGGSLEVDPSSASTTGAIIKLAASSSADAVKIEANDGSLLLGVDASGYLYDASNAVRIKHTTNAGTYLELRPQGAGGVYGGIAFSGTELLAATGTILKVGDPGNALGVGIYGASFNLYNSSQTIATTSGDLLAWNGYGMSVPKDLVVGSATPASDVAQLAVTTSAAGKRGLIVTSAASPTVDQFEIQDSGGVTQFVVDKNFNVGIGTNNPETPLQVIGDIRVGTSGTNGCIQGFGGAALTGTCSSDVRLKKDIESLGTYLDRVTGLRPVTYRWRSEEFPWRHYGDGLQVGLIAQEVKTVMPELVHEDKDGYLQIAYSELPIYSIEAIKELTEKVKGLEAELYEKETEFGVLKEYLCVKDPGAAFCTQ
jgi:hypothetical protein